MLNEGSILELQTQGCLEILTAQETCQCMEAARSDEVIVRECQFNPEHSGELCPPCFLGFSQFMPLVGLGEERAYTPKHSLESLELEPSTCRCQMHLQETGKNAGFSDAPVGGS